MANGDNETESRNGGGSGWLYAAIILTILYIIVVICAAGATTDSRECTNVSWLPNLIGCMTYNELGDFLAGASAPLAFIWLVAAVLIQSDELREQRRELELTRKSVDNNREVMKAQAEEARRQAEYIGEQTGLLKQENQARKDAARSRVFDTALTRLAGTLRIGQTALNVRLTPSNDKFIKINLNTLSNQNPIDYDLILRVTILIDYIISKGTLIPFTKPDDRPLNLTEKDGFLHIFSATIALTKLLDDLPDEARVKADGLRLREFESALCQIARAASNIDQTVLDDLLR